MQLLQYQNSKWARLLDNGHAMTWKKQYIKCRRTEKKIVVECGELSFSEIRGHKIRILWQSTKSIFCKCKRTSFPIDSLLTLGFLHVSTTCGHKFFILDVTFPTLFEEQAWALITCCQIAGSTRNNPEDITKPHVMAVPGSHVLHTWKSQWPWNVVSEISRKNGFFGRHCALSTSTLWSNCWCQFCSGAFTWLASSWAHLGEHKLNMNALFYQANRPLMWPIHCPWVWTLYWQFFWRTPQQ